MNWLEIHRWVILGLVFHQIVIRVPHDFEYDLIPGQFDTKQMDLKMTFLLDCSEHEHVFVVRVDQPYRCCSAYHAK